MTRSKGSQSETTSPHLCGLLYTDRKHSAAVQEDIRQIENEEKILWETDTRDSALEETLETMAKDIRSTVVGDVDAQERGNENEIESGKEEKTVCVTLIPGLPIDLSTKILARIPWVEQPKLIGVCKAWAACLRSDSIHAIRSREGLQESFLFTLSVMIKLGPLKLTVFDFKALPVDYDKPLATFEFLGRWSGFLRGFRCAVIGPNLFIIGGRHDGLQYATGKNVWKFNFITRKWTAAASMHSARRDFACAVINDRIYVAGGTHSSQVVPRGQGVATALQSVEMYDGEEDKWYSLPSLHTARVGCLGVALENRFYVIGGGSDHGTVRFEIFRSAEVFDPTIREWHTIDDMWQSEVQLPRAVAGYQGTLFAVDSGDQQLKVYDEEFNVWKVVMNMPFAAISFLPSKSLGGHAERNQAMGGLPGDHLILVPNQGLLWVGTCGFLSGASSLLRLEGQEGRGSAGTLGTESCPQERASALQKKLQKDVKAHLIIAAGTVHV